MPNDTIFVTGGAGYIGSHLVLALTRHVDFKRCNIVIIDDLSSGHKQAIEFATAELPESPQQVFFEQADIRSESQMRTIFKKYTNIMAVFHFAGLVSVADSVARPREYWETNVTGTTNLLKNMQKHGVKWMIFSSTAAIFGEPERVPIGEEDAKIPINPYGHTKLEVERILHWTDQWYGIKSVSLRYFNACGADVSGMLGEDRKEETHLIPLILKVPLGYRPRIAIFGNDYVTRDGTCVRDYIHVTDLAAAHIKSLEYLIAHNTSQSFNLGSGNGYTVQEIIDAARKVTGHEIPAEIKPRRSGDPASLIASSSKAERLLGWVREYDDIQKIVDSAWKFHSNHPDGYA